MLIFFLALIAFLFYIYFYYFGRKWFIFKKRKRFKRENASYLFLQVGLLTIPSENQHLNLSGHAWAH